MSRSPLQADVQAIGLQLAAAMPSQARHPLRRADEQALRIAGDDERLRAALLRFVDVVPACRSPDDLARHLVGYLDDLPRRPTALDAALRLSGTATGRAALGRAAAAGVRHTARRFIVAESPGKVESHLRALWRQGIASSLDLLGEAALTAAEADAYAEHCADALRRLDAVYRSLPERRRLECDSNGPIPRANLSVKISALSPLLRPQAPEAGHRDAARRLRELLALAARLGAHVHVDMESLDSREVVLDVLLELLAEPEFADGPSCGLVVQAYLRDSPTELERILEWATANPRPGAPLVVRLVKGAYWDHEVIEARQHGWEVPVFEDKRACDRNFEALTRRLLAARPAVRVAVASHNLRSVAHAIACDRAAGGDGRDLELQVLRGLGDGLARALASRGLRVRAYCPVGDLVAGMAYLVRRLLENTANESFLHAAAHGARLDELLAAP